ncbi:MAG TPA: hypothetical protein VGZ26_07870 [Pirellulales bacterium]|nr:hypothetical protein [Pirellulales bacterium]
MWCKACRQDVRGISPATAGSICCARCGAELSADEGPAARHAVGLAESAAKGLDLSAPQPSASAYQSFDEWEIDQSVRHLQARVGNSKRADRVSARTEPTVELPSDWRIHGSHPDVDGPHKHKSRVGGSSSPLAWFVLSLGLMAFACGSALVIWSCVEQRPELWSFGLPVAVAGQVGLLLGLILQLERIWQSSRYAVRKLEQVDSQLHHLERTATMLNVTHSSAAQAFYAHMADEANPQMLLADLKGQIDLLAISMSKRSA